MVAAFLVLSSPKGLRLDHVGASANACHLHREEHKAQELQEELQEMLSPLIGDTPISQVAGVVVQALDGGCLAAFGDESEVCTAVDHANGRIAVFQGYLRNMPLLVEKCTALAKPSSPNSTNTHSRGSSVNGDVVGNPDRRSDLHHASSPAGPEQHESIQPMNAASIVLQLYGAYGSPMLAQLTGKFSFCMYDAKQVRVLAARDGSGAIPLLQARTAKNSLALSSNPALLKTCHDVVLFDPGCFKYGWQSPPRLFTAADAAPPHAAAAVRRSIEQRRSMDHHHHHHGSRKSVDLMHSPNGARKSVDGSWRSTENGNHHQRSARSSIDRPVSRRTSVDNHATGLKAKQATLVSRPSGSCAVPAAAMAAETLSTHLVHLNINAKAFVPSAGLTSTT